MLERVQLRSAGYCVHPEAMTRLGAAWTPCRFPSGFAAIHHAQNGTLLFDTGYSERFARETRAFPAALYARITPVHLTQSETACRQLEREGVATQDVRYVVVSHFHADHFAGLRDFTAARIVCSRVAWESVRGLGGLRAVSKGFLPGLLPDDIEERLLFVESCTPVELAPSLGAFGRGHDLLGDRSVIAVELPGHAPGHIGLFLESPERGPMLLAGDAAWSQAAIETATPPPRLTTGFLGNTRAYRATLAKLNAIRRAAPDLAIIPSHCAFTFGFGQGE